MRGYPERRLLERRDYSSWVFFSRTYLFAFWSSTVLSRSIPDNACHALALPRLRNPEPNTCGFFIDHLIFGIHFQQQKQDWATQGGHDMVRHFTGPAKPHKEPIESSTSRSLWPLESSMRNRVLKGNPQEKESEDPDPRGPCLLYSVFQGVLCWILAFLESKMPFTISGIGTLCREKEPGLQEKEGAWLKNCLMYWFYIHK